MHEKTELNDAVISDLIIEEIRLFAGGPRSLKYKPSTIIRASCFFIGRLRALTMREDNFNYLESQLNRFDAQVLKYENAFTGCQGEDPKIIALGLSIHLAQPTFYKRPSNLILGALQCFVAQLAVSDGWNLASLIELIQESQRETPLKSVNEFQRISAQTKKN